MAQLMSLEEFRTRFVRGAACVKCEAYGVRCKGFDHFNTMQDAEKAQEVSEELVVPASEVSALIRAMQSTIYVGDLLYFHG